MQWRFDRNADATFASLPLDSHVIIFDGDCVLCSRSMRAVHFMDKEQRIKLTAAQGEIGQAIYRYLELPADNFETYLIVMGDQIFGHSTALVKMAALLDWPWKALAVFWVVPRPIRDALYSLIARYRYKIFGRRTACGQNIPELSERMIPSSDLSG